MKCLMMAPAISMFGSMRPPSDGDRPNSVPKFGRNSRDRGRSRQWKPDLRILTIEQSTPSWDSGRNSAAGTLMMAVPKESVPYEKNLEDLLRPWVLRLSPRVERERKGT